MLEVIYASAATEPFSPSQLAELLKKARSKNHRLQVSGILLYHKGSFLQMLEGEDSIVTSLYDLIAKDPRHHRIMMIKRSAIEDRAFADWSMGFVEVSPMLAAKLEGFNSFLQQDLLETKRAADQLRKVLRQFRAGEWRQYVT